MVASLLGASSDDGDIVTPATDRQAEVGSGESENNSELRTPHSALDPAVDYLTLSAAQLRELCDERGIAYKKNAGVKTLAALLNEDDNRPLPELTAADPVW